MDGLADHGATYIPQDDVLQLAGSVHRFFLLKRLELLWTARAAANDPKTQIELAQLLDPSAPISELMSSAFVDLVSLRAGLCGAEGVEFEKWRFEDDAMEAVAKGVASGRYGDFGLAPPSVRADSPEPAGSSDDDEDDRWDFFA